MDSTTTTTTTGTPIAELDQDLHGSARSDVLTGGGGNDRVFGGAGADTMDGRGGSDNLNAGSGDDKLIYRLAENAGTADVYMGGSGKDTVSLHLTVQEWLAHGSKIGNYLSHLAAVTNTKTGEVSNGQASDFSFVFGTSRLDLQMIESLEVVVNGETIDPRAPFITSDKAGATAAVSIGENTSAVTTVTAASIQAGTVFKYSIVGGEDSGRFTIDPDTGVLAFRSPPDFEAPGDVGQDNVYDVQVQVSDGQRTDTQRLSVTVTDRNEAPQAVLLSSSTVAENAAGAVIGSLSTTDPDAGDVHTYAVDDARFEVVGNTLKLKSGVSLDFEATPGIEVNVKTTDAGGLSTVQALKVAVTNVNEAPTDIDLSAAKVDENAAGAVIGALTTVDPDQGDTHTYAVDDGRFEVLDGSLRLKADKSLDHEAEDTVKVTVTATDKGGLDIAEAFTIEVNDVNEAPTDIDLSAAKVDENDAGAVIGSLSTVDPDQGDTHTYAVDDDRFEVVDGSLRLKAGKSLDHEAEDTVKVTVTATDKGGLDIAEAFTIEVNDVNEAPTDIGLSASKVNENAAGAVIGTLSTLDPDQGDTHTYAVDDDRFEVVDGSLRLKAGKSLDHEAEDTVKVTVTATDKGGLDITEAFTIEVNDVNEAPTDIGLSAAKVDENDAGAVIGSLSTVDPDQGDTHTYAVDDDRFEVLDGSLRLKAGKSLDHEAGDTVKVTVTATDKGGLDITEAFTIEVNDVNEAPTDIDLSAAKVDENDAGAVIGSLSTVDPDQGDTHTYAVDDDRFEVVDGSLRLKAGKSLDHEAEDTVKVTVTATDKGGLDITEAFDIEVTDVNEAPTAVELSSNTVAENDAGAVIGTLSTVDPDAGDSHTYTVSDKRFEVVKGQLKLVAGVSLDHETTPTVDLTVTSQDAGGRPRPNG